MNGDGYDGSQRYPEGVADACDAKAKLTMLGRNLFGDTVERVDIGSPTHQTFEENDHEDDPYVRNVIVEDLTRQEGQVDELENWEDGNEWDINDIHGRPGDENSDLVDHLVPSILLHPGKPGVLKVEELKQTLVDEILSKIYQQQWDHKLE